MDDLFDGPSAKSLFQRPQRALSVGRAFAIVLTTIMGFGTGGATIGYGLGRFAPGYYRSVFSDARDLDFNPMQLGIGLGLTQGLACGVVVGMAVILAVSLSHRRLRQSA